MKVTLVRHGEVDTAYLGCYNGHNTIGLSEKGHAQARALAETFRGRAFDAVYCSDLPRARQTLDPFVLNVTPVFSEELREKSWGRHEGMRFEAICAREGLAYEDFGQWLGALGGESVDAFVGRVRGFFLEELAPEACEEVLVMTHAGVIRVLMHLLKGISLQEAFSVDFPYGAYTTLESSRWEFGAVQCV
jgi:broad specificity phosphatase PhoE